MKWFLKFCHSSLALEIQVKILGKDDYSFLLTINIYVLTVVEVIYKYNIDIIYIAKVKNKIGVELKYFIFIC